jgi:hypothetical protein
VTPLQDGPDYKAQMESRSINSSDRATPQQFGHAATPQQDGPYYKDQAISRSIVVDSDDVVEE